MSVIHTRIRSTAAGMLLGCYPTGTSTPGVLPEQDGFSVSSDLMLAGVSAYKEHERRWRERQGRKLSSAEFLEGSYRVGVVRNETGDYEVSFGPPSMDYRGGGFLYVVDGSSFEVVRGEATR